jgi:Hemerythrin HHE cation binding domain
MALSVRDLVQPEITLIKGVPVPRGGPGPGVTSVDADDGRDHAEVKTLTNQLVRATEENDEPMRRLLYGLYHVIRLHFPKEEEIYLPLLEEDLDRAEADQLLHAMGTA